MEKKFIKMNNNKDYVSLGNLFNIIKRYSKVKDSSTQTEIFCSIFDINNISNTTVNNYLIGYRAISLEYKKIYVDLKNTYEKNKNIFFKIVSNILTILEENIYTVDNINFDIINNNIRLNKVCNDLIKLSIEDINIEKDFLDRVNKLYTSNNLYECLIEFLFYTILENKQPIFIEKIDLNFRSNELEDYLKINLYEGISYISSLTYLSKKGNMYANAEMGSLEYSGLITGNKNYEKSYQYYLKAARKDHPKACWMVANLILMDKVKEKNINYMWKYLLKACDLGSVAALNTLGKCFLYGNNPEKIIDVDKAIEYFKKASDMGYSYAYNNLGVYYENNSDMNKAFKYYKLSADLNNSWALNKVGEILRKDGNLKDAFFYYLKSSDAPINERNYYSYYNLAKYYYIPGCKELNIKSDIKKAIKLLKDAYNNGIKVALKEIKKQEKSS